MSRTTIYGWTEKGTLLASKSTRRGLSIPAAQILGPGKVARVSRMYGWKIEREKGIFGHGGRGAFVASVEVRWTTNFYPNPTT